MANRSKTGGRSGAAARHAASNAAPLSSRRVPSTARIAELRARLAGAASHSTACIQMVRKPYRIAPRMAPLTRPRNSTCIDLLGSAGSSDTIEHTPLVEQRLNERDDRDQAGCARPLQDTGSDAGPCETAHHGFIVRARSARAVTA